MLAIQKLPLAAAGVVVATLSEASFRMVGPIYKTQVGLEIGQIAYFLAAFVLGGALAQVPVGWLADKFDCRKVMIWLSVAAMVSCLVTILMGGYSTTCIFLTALFFGLKNFPIFSVATAHAHDFAEPNESVELSAALIFFYALGAIAATLLASPLIDNFGPPALCIMIALAHLALIAFGLTRIRKRPTWPDRTSYVYAPRTSFVIGRLLKRKRDER
jgi:MFS family permease